MGQNGPINIRLMGLQVSYWHCVKDDRHRRAIGTGRGNTPGSWLIWTHRKTHLNTQGAFPGFWQIETVCLRFTPGSNKPPLPSDKSHMIVGQSCMISVQISWDLWPSQQDIVSKIKTPGPSGRPGTPCQSLSCTAELDRHGTLQCGHSHKYLWSHKHFQIWLAQRHKESHSYIPSVSASWVKCGQQDNTEFRMNDFFFFSQ